jgi:hypothetical protein
MTSKFDAIVPGTAKYIKNMFGTTGTYTQSGTDYSLVVIVDTALSVYPDLMTSSVSADDFEIEFYTSDLPVTPDRGDTVTVDGVTYRVVNRIDNDGFWTKLAVTKE